MCTVSMVMDAKLDDWTRRYYEPGRHEPVRWVQFPSQQEIEEFHRLLDRAREYDRQHNQLDCELEDKRQKLREMAKELGVEISFV